MRVLGWLELQSRRMFVLGRKDPARHWLRWARASHHGDVALACLDRAVALGDPDAHLELGLVEAEGYFGAADPVPSYRRAAERGHEEAMVHLANCLRWGPGPHRDADQAKVWLTRSAEQGFRPAAEALSQWLGELGDDGAAEAWRTKAAALPPRSLRSSLLNAMVARDPLMRAQDALLAATDQGLGHLFQRPWASSLALVLLALGAVMLLLVFLVLCVLSLGLLPAGLGVYILLFGRKQWHHRRFRTLVDAAQAGDAESAYHLGRLYQTGQHGVMKDDLSSALWFRKAAEGGHYGAMGALGEALATGHGVAKNLKEAALWKAASKG